MGVCLSIIKLDYKKICYDGDADWSCGWVPRVQDCKDPILFDLVSYCDVRVQSNPFILKGVNRIWYKIRKRQGYIGGELHGVIVNESRRE